MDLETAPVFVHVTESSGSETPVALGAHSQAPSQASAPALDITGDRQCVAADTSRRPGAGQGSQCPGAGSLGSVLPSLSTS